MTRYIRRWTAAILLALGALHGVRRVARAADCGPVPWEFWGSLCPMSAPLFVCGAELSGEPDNWHFVGCLAF